MTVSRRKFLVGTAVATVAIPVFAGTKSLEVEGEYERSVLVDTTRCIGCRACESACAEANGLPAPPDNVPAKRDTSPTAFTVVNTFGERTAKRQCMHCVQPACASACPVRALDKQKTGPVAYHADRCMGCRYCMVACPFEIPKYEYNKAIPTVKKCIFCFDRQEKGQPPACTDICPAGALTFGQRGDLLREARKRVYGNPDKYFQHIYGEHEAGGTNWLYISDVRPNEIGLKVGIDDAYYPALVKGALSVPPFVMTLWPPILMGLWAFSRSKENKDE